MEFFEVLLKRRSIRRFADKPVGKDKIEYLLKCAFLSPSSHNHRPWHFIVVTRKDLLIQLSKSKEGAQGLKNATAAIVVCADSDVSDVWIEDAAIAAHNINLAAVDIGLGSFWVQIRNRWHDQDETAGEYVKRLLNITEKNLEVLSIIGFGYKLKDKLPNTPGIETEKVTWIE